MNPTLLCGIAGTTLFLTGCVMAPNYSRPAPPVPAVLPGGGTRADGASVVRDLAWKTFLPDPKLQAIVEMSLTNNRSLRIAALNVERARALYGIQRSELFPVVYATGAGSKQRTSADLTRPGEPRTVQRADISLGIASWEIDFFGRIRSLKEKALQEYLGTEQARRSARIALIAEVARVYFLLAADREGGRLARLTLESQQGVHELIGRQYEQRLATELDFRRSQTQVDAARGEIARYEQLAAQDLNALTLLAGAPVPEDLLPADLAGIAPPNGIFPDLASEVLLRRPDILAAEHQLKAAYAFIGAARSALFPRISLTTALGTASDDLAGLFGSGTGTWSFAPQIAIPIFDARSWAAYRVSKTARDLALAEYERAIQTAFREVADSLAVRDTVDRQIASQQAIVDSAQKIHELSGQRHAQGLDSYLGVLDAQRTLYAARQGLTSLTFAGMANRVRLYAVLGGDTEPQRAPPGGDAPGGQDRK